MASRPGPLIWGQAGLLICLALSQQDFYFLINLFIFIFGCVGSSFLCEGFL